VGSATEKRKLGLALSQRSIHNYEMDRTKSYKFETPRFIYAQLERGLGDVFNLDAKAQQSVLRSRLKHLQRLGLPGLQPGKGARVQYSQEQAMQWLLALLVAQLGIDPVVTVQTIKAKWRDLVPNIKQATDQTSKRGNPICIGLRPRVMTNTWAEGKPSLQISAFRRYNFGPTLSGDRDEIPHVMDSEPDSWLCVIDFTRPASHLETMLR
jgi:hypothetical protein